MIKQFITSLLLIPFTLVSQEKLVNLSEINFCNMTIEDLQKMDPDIHLVSIEQKDFCIDNSTEDGSSEMKFGYQSRLFPGVRFYQPKNEQNIIEKIHLTNEFKGYLPDGKFVEIKTLFVSNIVKLYTSQIISSTNKCNDYFEMIKDEGADFILKIYKRNKLMESGKLTIYEQQITESIDLLFECYFDSIDDKYKPLYVVDGKLTSEKEFLDLNPDTIKSVTVLKEKNAEAKYGKRGKNGVIEVILIK